MRRIVVIALLLFFAYVSASATALKVEAKADYLKFSAALEKASYVEGEPIAIKCTLLNDATETHRLAEPAWDMSVEYEVKRVGGKVVERKAIGEKLIFTDYGWDFKPKESRSAEDDLAGMFALLLTPGSYSVTVVYTPPKETNDIWHGTMKTPELKFTIEKPSNALAPASKAFNDRFRPDNDPTHWTALAKTFGSFADAAKAGVFGRYAGYCEASAYRVARDEDGYAAALKKYVAKHADVPVYGKLAREELGNELCMNGQKNEGLALIRQSPDSYARRMIMRFWGVEK